MSPPGASPCPDGVQASVYETDCPWFDSKQGGRECIELPVSLDCERRSSKPIRSGSIPDGEAKSSLSRWTASIGLLSRLSWSDSKQGGCAPCPADRECRS